MCMSLSPALALYVYNNMIHYTVHAFIIIHVCFFVAVVIFRPAQLFIGNISFISRARAVYDDGALFILFIFFVRSFVYRCYCSGVRCVLKNHNRITMHHHRQHHHSLKSVRFLRLSVRKRKKNTKQNKTHKPCRRIGSSGT